MSQADSSCSARFRFLCFHVLVHSVSLAHMTTLSPGSICKFFFFLLILVLKYMLFLIEIYGSFYLNILCLECTFIEKDSSNVCV